MLAHIYQSSIINNSVFNSGANDGLGYPFLFLAIYLIQMSTVGEAILKWSWWIIGYEIGFSIVIGFLVGFVARKILRYSEERYCKYYIFHDSVIMHILIHVFYS
jgi:NhaP-type Na+/H+ or K+/H+ antiporter